MIEPTRETLFIHVDVCFDWRDRLRVLFGRTVHVRTVQRVWVDAGTQGICAPRAESTVYVDTIRPRKPTAAADLTRQNEQ